MDDFNRKRHAVYKLTYHAVFVIKYRRKVMSEPIIDHVRQYAAHLIEQCYQGRLIELNGELDHIHIPVSYTHLEESTVYYRICYHEAAGI